MEQGRPGAGQGFRKTKRKRKSLKKTVSRCFQTIDQFVLRNQSNAVIHKTHTKWAQKMHKKTAIACAHESYCNFQSQPRESKTSPPQRIALESERKTERRRRRRPERDWSFRRTTLLSPGSSLSPSQTDSNTGFVVTQRFCIVLCQTGDHYTIKLSQIWL